MTMSSASTSSVQKSIENRSKSCDTVCTSNSSCFLKRRKPVNPLAYSLRPNVTRTVVSNVRQRVLSAKLLKLRSIQSQLNDANFHLSELSRENHVLKTLQKRQDKALSKYENTNADLPRLLHSHEEEIRILTEKNKILNRSLREVTELLKSKEKELTNTTEKLRHLEKLNTSKRLIEREKLMEQVEDFKEKLEKSEAQVTTLNRKLLLENKSSKQKLNTEATKHRQCQKDLNQAMSEIERLTKILDSNENIPKKNRFTRIPNRQTMSLVSLGGHSNRSSSPSNETPKADYNDLDASKSAVSEIKLEPLPSKKLEEPTRKSKQNGILKIPSENIRNRLSSGGNTSVKNKEFEDVSINKPNLNSTESDVTLIDNWRSSTVSSRPNSSQKLAKLSETLEAAIQKATENSKNDFDTRLGDYCTQVVNSVKNCSEIINNHKENLNTSKLDTENLLDALEETKNIESKLKQTLLTNNSRNLDFVNEILNEEYKFQAQHEVSESTADKNGNVTKKDPQVRMEEKKKLLAALRAIDNGESFESVETSPENETRLMKELFGEGYD